MRDLILAIETSAKAASAAVVTKEGEIVSECFVNAGLTHSQTLMPMVQSDLESAALGTEDIGVYAVAQGPGSFTGIRIGIAAVKGMALGSGKGCIGVSTLLALAENCTSLEGLICCAMDARCNQVYNALFTCKGGVLTRLTPDRALAIEALMEELKTFEIPIFLVGDGAKLCYNKFDQNGVHCALVGENLRYARAASVGLAAAALLKEQAPIDPSGLDPIYLRLPQAQRELKRKQEEGKKETK